MRSFLFIAFLLPFIVLAQNKPKIDSLSNLTVPQIQLNLDKVIPELKKNVEDAKRLKKTRAEAKSSALLALALYFRGDYDQNIVYATRAIHLFEKLGDWENVAKEYSELGYRIKATNIKDSELYLLKAKKIAELGNHKRPLLSIYNQYGEVKSMLGQEDSAMIYFQKGLKVKQEMKDSVGIPYSLVNIGYSYAKSRQFDLAKKYFDEALQLRIALKDDYGISDCYAYYGDLYVEMKDYQLAAANYEKSVEIAEKYKITNLLRHDYKMLILCYDELENADKTIEYFKKNQVLKDSILNKETNEKIAELQIKFDTAEKEKQLLKQSKLDEKRKKTIQMLIIAAIAILLIAAFWILLQRMKNANQKKEFALQTSIEKIEHENEIQEQRLSISRDLHDNIGAQLTFIISSVDTLKSNYQIDDEKVNNKLNSISDFTKDTITELRDTIWVMNNAEISFEEMAARLANFVEKAKTSHENITFSFSIDPQLKGFSFASNQSMSIYRIVQEAVNNSLKYARASELLINVKKVGHTIEIEVNDNGLGFDINNIIPGSGLSNMKKRANEINAQLSILSTIGIGTKVILNFKLS